MKNVAQTAELLSFVAGLIHDIIEAHKKDGDIGAWDSVKIGMQNLRPAIEAAQGIRDVPAELADLEADELDALYMAVMQRLQWPERSVSRAMFNANYNFLKVCVEHFRVMQRLIHPPKAVVIPEIEGVDPP